ncbi:hypothetical protein ACJX0J_029101 [Zea mays]
MWHAVMSIYVVAVIFLAAHESKSALDVTFDLLRGMLGLQSELQIFFSVQFWPDDKKLFFIEHHLLAPVTLGTASPFCDFGMVIISLLLLRDSSKLLKSSP